jgi:hypothetical protein
MMDDDGNGLVDEGCTCDPETTQPCWPGTITRRGVGACRDGVQRCEAFGEFMAWGACNDAVLPSEEIAGNCIDEDCDGVMPGCEGSSCAEFENCGPNGVDEDCDGLIDCNDPDCPSCDAPPGCTPTYEFCTGGVDEDCDGSFDCADTDCSSSMDCRPPGCEPEFPFFVEIACGDGRDNDCDSLIDCMDPDCRSPGRCGCAPSESRCSDGTDEDCDHATDCGDTDCQRCVPGASRWCDDPMYCHWGRQTCDSEGHWGTCVEVPDAPTGCDGTRAYSRDCCVDSGACCENYPTDHSSVGHCDMVERSCG